MPNLCTAAHAVESLQQLNFYVLKHPSFVLIWLLLIHMFGSLRDTSRGHHFANDQEVRAAMHV
jgi:hypothetical protein